MGEDAVRRLVGEAQTLIGSGVDNLRRRFRKTGWRSAVFAETPLAAGLATLMEEIGLRPVLVALRDDSLGGAAEFRREVARIGVPMPRDLELLENPPLGAAQERLERLAGGGELKVLLGSAHEAAAAAGVPGLGTVEVGFPRVSFHPRGASPTYGFAGAQTLCDRILEHLSSSAAGPLPAG